VRSTNEKDSHSRDHVKQEPKHILKCYNTELPNRKLPLDNKRVCSSSWTRERSNWDAGDLQSLDATPLENIDNTRKIRTVAAAGRIDQMAWRIALYLNGEAFERGDGDLHKADSNRRRTCRGIRR
jgi:hypothetical protein